MMVNMMAIIFLSVSMQSISALIFLAILLSIASLKSSVSLGSACNDFYLEFTRDDKVMISL